MSGLVIGLCCGLGVCAVVIFCCIRSVCREKSAISRQVKQVQQVDEDPYFDDVEAPTPPSEQNTRRGPPKSTITITPPDTSTAAAATTAATAAAAKKGSRKSSPTPALAVAPAHDAPPSYDELLSTADTTPEHVYGDDSEEFKGRHQYQASGDPYDAPVRVSRSTERRSGSLRTLSPEAESRTSSLSSSRGRAAVAEASRRL